MAAKFHAGGWEEKTENVKEVDGAKKEGTRHIEVHGHAVPTL